MMVSRTIKQSGIRFWFDRHSTHRQSSKKGMHIPVVTFESVSVAALTSSASMFWEDRRE